MKKLAYFRHSAVITRSTRWKALRFMALRRDGFRCCECGAVGRLEVHHKKPVRTHPELAYDLANCESLCPPCHGRRTRAEIVGPDTTIDRQAWRDLLRTMRQPRDHEDARIRKNQPPAE